MKRRWEDREKFQPQVAGIKTSLPTAIIRNHSFQPRWQVMHEIFQLSLLSSDRLCHRAHLETLGFKECLVNSDCELLQIYWVEFLTGMNVKFCLCDLAKHQAKLFPMNFINGQCEVNKLNIAIASINMGSEQHTPCLKAAALTARERREPRDWAQRAATSGDKLNN